MALKVIDHVAFKVLCLIVAFDLNVNTRIADIPPPTHYDKLKLCVCVCALVWPESVV